MIAEIKPESGPKTGMAKTLPFATRTFPAPRMVRAFSRNPSKSYVPEEFAPRGFVFEIELGQFREIDALHRNAGPISRIFFG